MNELPMELLLKIVSYLPDNKAFALVNRRCYDAVCTVDANEPTMRLGVFPQFLELDEKQFVKSIMDTTRTVRNIMVSFLSLERPVVIDVIKKFAENIDYLRACAELAIDLIDAIELVPNVVHLELILLSDYKDDYVPPSKKRRQDEPNKELNLLRLRKLNIERFYDHQLLGTFNRLPAGVLVELSLHQKSLSQLANLFRTQTNIKKLTIFCDRYRYREEPEIDEKIFDALQIESIKWHGDKFEHVRPILSKQMNLKTLELIGRELDVDLWNVITNQFNKLETLSIPVSNIPVAAIKNISKLVNMNKLTLQSGYVDNCVEQFKEFSTLDNSRITAINIQHCCYMSNDLINTMAKSLPNLKNVSFHCDYNVKTFYAILQNFNYVDAIHLDAFNTTYEIKDRKGNYTMLLQEGCENVRLTELKICYPISYTVKIVEKIAKDYPHLKKLVILPPDTPTNRDFDKQLKTILTGFKELESLSILRDNNMSLESRYHDLDLIEKYGINLKFVALCDMECTTLSNFGKKFKKKLGVIKYSRSEGLRMAVSRKTMEIEWKDVEHCR